MGEILHSYRRPDPTTWVYMSSFLTIGLFFVFHRFWSVRNLDIVLLILLAPGLLMVHEGRRRQMREFEAQIAHTAFVNSHDDEASLADNAIADEEISNDQSRSEDASLETTVDVGDITQQWLVAMQANDSLRNDADTVNAALVSSPYSPEAIQLTGFIWLFVVQGLILVRLMLDPLMVRRPLLDPNLTIGGLNFIGISLFVFMMANVVTSTPRLQQEQGPKLGPGYPLMHMLPAIPTRPVSDSLIGAEPPGGVAVDEADQWLTTVAKVLAIFAHVATVMGIVLIGERHFSNLRAGIGCASLYLLLPYTAQMTGRVDHALPAALLLWAVLMYRKPMVAGVFLGLAAGLVYYPLFLLPLWFSFYWQRGARRFGMGVAATLSVLMILLSVAGTESLLDHLRRMYGIIMPTWEPRGIWALGWNPVWRFPVIAGFVILSGFFAVWPTQKNLGTLISCTAAVMVGAQFWHGDGGGLYIAWFLPMLLLTIFRPNLQDRVALKVIDGGVGNIRQRARLGVEAA